MTLQIPHTSDSTPKRNRRLDILRCVAVLLVLLHHGNVSHFFSRAGWAGVDLFFVLSGFLISGLLFGEYKKRRSISFKRFFVRRGLKIYPAFYAFLLLTAIISHWFLGAASTPRRYLHEILFVQNYGAGVWDHTWSLAVEEHFYIFLPLFLVLLVRLSPNREDPFHVIPWAYVAIGTLCLVTRAISVCVGTPNFKMAYISSHERMDPLFFGVLLGYYHHFRPQALEELVRPNRNRLIIGLVSVGFVSLAYFLPRENRFLATCGYSLIYLGFGGILLLSLYVRGILPSGFAVIARPVASALAFIGMYSYSIYLWHGPCGSWLPGLVRDMMHLPRGTYARFAVYFPGSLVVGIIMSHLIEYPVLHLRDRFFPAAQAIPNSGDPPATKAPAVAAEFSS